ncbi:DUF4238 domain-containing protein [Flavobacterium sp. 17A]|uniref:DUF4238 domain-containing protein n=1 Tax=Flavobacterium potami TaxID=2872310 RepID=A0A9X1H7J5_9FLAO|nr:MULTISPECIES: DUF4238 domain-containing protein [Flavobacterium]MBZ4033905.1 DUF4238 domain-containing protein [Flavobacterium potami]
MPDVKRQHYVPRTYLKNFSEQRGDNFFIKALPKNSTAQEKIYEIAISNVCVQTDLYTLPGETEEQRMLIEKFYSENYEKHYKDVYDILTNPNKKTITEEERELIISTVVTMLYRTTKWISQHNSFFDRILENAYNLAISKGFDYFMYEDQKISFADKTLEQLQKEYKKEERASQVITQLEVALNLIKWRLEKNTIMVVRITDEAEYITSDNPVVYQNRKGKLVSPFDASNILKLPLDSKHLLLLMPYGDETNKLSITRSERLDEASFQSKVVSNFLQFGNSERFILGTDKGLKTYLNDKKETEREITPEEKIKFDKKDAELDRKLKELGML